MGCHHCEPVPVVVTVDLTPVLARLDSLEALLSTAAEQINALTGRFDALNDVVVDVHADFVAFRDAMLAERENLTAAGQAALDHAIERADAAGAALESLNTEVGDADGSDTPPAAPAPEEPPAEPVA